MTNKIEYNIEDYNKVNESIANENLMIGDWIHSLMNTVAKQVFEKLAKKYGIPYMWASKATTTSAINTSVTVEINRDGSSVTVINKTGEAIAIGDKVYLISPTGSLTNSFAITKF